MLWCGGSHVGHLVRRIAQRWCGTVVTSPCMAEASEEDNLAMVRSWGRSVSTCQFRFSRFTGCHPGLVGALGGDIRIRRENFAHELVD
jgi:hypothetical protein